MFVPYQHITLFEVGHANDLKCHFSGTKCKVHSGNPGRFVLESGWRSGSSGAQGGNGMYIAVCDDQSEELEALLALLRAWQTERRASVRIRAFRSAGELLDAARKERFTLYLLDVMMPGTDGMAAAREIRGFDSAADLVFLTSSPGFAYESYSVQALEYLLKPISAKLLYPLLDKLLLRERKPQDGLTIKSGGTLIRVPFSQLTYVEVSGKHLYFNLSDGTVREIVGSMKDYEGALLAQEEFMRIHRSYIVNMLQIEELSPAGVVTFSGKSLPVSRLLYPQLQKDYMQLLFAEREV